MTELKLLRCEGCGAPLPAPKGGQTSLTCNYCGRELVVVSGSTQVMGQAAARPLTDELLAGRSGSDAGSGRRYSAAEMERRDWPARERGLWPVDARASSSWGSAWSARALLGPPTVFPRHGDIAGAWAPSTRDSEVEWIEVDFRADAPPAQAIRVFETNLPGASFAVTILDQGREELVWRRAPISDGYDAKVLEIELTPPRTVRRLRVYVNNSLGSSWSEVDTVGLVAVTPLPMAMRSSPSRTSALTRNRGCLLAGLALVGVIAATIAIVKSASHASATPTPPAASVRVPGTTLMTWNISAAALAQSGVVWANAVPAFSSQYSDSSNAARRVTGPPDVLPSYGDDPAAWAPLGQVDGMEFVEVRFAAPVRASAVVIVETYNPGALARVEDITPGRDEALLWEGATEAPSGSRVLSVEMPEPRAISAVRVVLDTRRCAGWNEIDAVGLFPAQ